MDAIEAMNARLGIPGVAQVVARNGGLAAVKVTTADAEGLVYLHGAHVAAWRPAGADEVLWLSQKSWWEDGKSIRGGVPVCFPWFGPRKATETPASPPAPPSPAHGFARFRAWELESIRQDAAGVTVTLALKSDEATLAVWPHDFVLRHVVTFGKQLVMALELTNTGTAPLTAEEALHTYFAVGEVSQVEIAGLAATKYIDKVDGFKEKLQEDAIRMTGETDRVYLDTVATVTIDDPIKRRRIEVSKDNSRNTVVWNPWIAKAKAMADYGDEEWPGMVCVETCNVGAAAVTVGPGQTHRMAARVELA